MRAPSTIKPITSPRASAMPAFAARAGDGGAGSSRCSVISGAEPGVSSSRTGEGEPLSTTMISKSSAATSCWYGTESDRNVRGNSRVIPYAMTTTLSAGERENIVRETGSVGSSEIVRRTPPPEEQHASADDHDRSAD